MVILIVIVVRVQKQFALGVMVLGVFFVIIEVSFLIHQRKVVPSVIILENLYVIEIIDMVSIIVIIHPLVRVS